MQPPFPSDPLKTEPELLTLPGIIGLNDRRSFLSKHWGMFSAAEISTDASVGALSIRMTATSTW
jgi:hypothetical protein